MLAGVDRCLGEAMEAQLPARACSDGPRTGMGNHLVPLCQHLENFLVWGKDVRPKTGGCLPAPIAAHIVMQYGYVGVYTHWAL